MNSYHPAIVLLTLMTVLATAQEEVSPLERELRYVHDNALAVLIVRPAKMLEAESLNQNPLADLAGPTGIKPSDVETLVVAVVPGTAPAFDVGVVLSIEFKENAPQAVLRRTLSPGSEQPEGWPFPVYDGQSQRHRVSLAFPTPKTAVISTDGAGFYDALAVGSLKAFEKPSLRALCGDETNGSVFAAGDLDRLVHAATFAGGTVSPAAGEIHDAVPTPAVSRVRAKFDLTAKNALVVDVVAGDGSVSGEQLREGLGAFVKRVSADVGGIVDTLVQSDPALVESRQSLRTLITNLQVVALKNQVRLQLAESIKPADAWWHVMKCVGLYQHHQSRQVSQLRGRLNLLNLGLAIHNYHNVFSRWPANIESDDGKPLLSWRVRVLPYLGQNGLYEQFKTDEAWDSPHNKKLLKHMPSSFGVPGVKASDGLTHVKFPVLQGAPPESLAAIKDGTASTIAILESKERVPWTKPVDHEVSKLDPWKGVSEEGWFCFADAHVSRIDKRTVGAKLMHAFTPASGDEFASDEPTELTRSAKPFIKARLAAAGADESLADTPNSARGGAARADVFLALIRSEDAIVVGIALLGLESTQAEYNWQRLLPLLNSRFDFVRNKAIELMAKTEQPGVVAAIFKPDGPDQKTVWQMLYETSLGENYAAKELLPHLRHKSRDYRIGAGFAIATFGGKKYRGQIAALLKDPDEIVRKEAANMLKVIDSSQ